MAEQQFGVGPLEVEGRIFPLRLQEDIAIALAALSFDAVPVEVEDVFDALHVHREALEPVGHLHRDRLALDAADLLEIGELA